jgi:hypothetical protein
MTEVEYQKKREEVDSLYKNKTHFFIMGAVIFISMIIVDALLLSVGLYDNVMSFTIIFTILFCACLGMGGYCGIRGRDMEIELDVYGRQHRQQKEPVSGSRRNCVKCGREIPFDANLCPYCGYDYQE